MILNGQFVSHLKRIQWGQINRWTVRFAIKGHAAISGIDFSKTTFPTIPLEKYRAAYQKTRLSHSRTKYLTFAITTNEHTAVPAGLRALIKEIPTLAQRCRVIRVLRLLTH